MSEIDIYKHIGQQMISDREKIKELEAEIQELHDSITWWNNRYNALQRDYEDYKLRYEKVEEIRKEHSIMKQFIYENGLWEKFLNDDRFMEHLRSDK